MQEVSVRRGATRTQTAQAQQNRAEHLLFAQRDELQEQLRQLAERRIQLFGQLHTTPEGAARREIESRMSEIDARSARLDGQLAALNDRILETMGRTNQSAPVVVDVPRVVVPSISIPPFEGRGGFFQQRGPNPRQIAGIMAAEAVVFALIGVIFWRMGMKRVRESFERIFSQQSAQMNQLQQAVDVIGIEVERISEGQRYVAKVIGEGSPAGVGRAESKVPVGRRDV